MADIGEVIGLIKKLGGGGGGSGTSNYNSLSNKPQINGVTLSGNKTAADLGLDAVVPVFTPDQSQTPSEDSTQPVPLLCDKTFDEVSAACIAGECPYAIINWIPDSDYQIIARLVGIAVDNGSGMLMFEGMAEASQFFVQFVKIGLSESAIGVTRSSPNVSDVKVNGTSITDANGVANVPLGSNETTSTQLPPGVVRAKNGTNGISIDSAGYIKVSCAAEVYYKNGTESGKPIPPSFQHLAAFYGLAKAAGADMKNLTGITVGVYPAAQKSAIQSMLGVEPGVSFVETVSGTTPTITGEANVRYICGEVSTLSITPPVAGTIVVRFTSGSTATVLTLPQTVVFPAGVDLTTLDADTVYEIMITDGVYGGVMTWAVSA